MKKLALLTLSALIPLSAHATLQEALYVREFVGGLNLKKVADCEQRYNEMCKTNSGSAISRLTKQRACSANLMAKDKECLQASRIRQLSYAPPTQMKRFGDIAVFDVTSLADGVDSYYMVDKKGNFIAMNTHLDLTSNETFKKLKDKYPEATLTGFLYWTKLHENLFPKVYSMPDKTKRLVFKQEVRNGYFVAGEKIGVAHVAYDFDKSGNYMGAKLLKLDEISQG